MSTDPNVTCTRCGYSLRGLAEDGRCPECGMPFDHRQADDATEQEWRQLKRKLHRVDQVLAAGILLIVAIIVIVGVLMFLA